MTVIGSINIANAPNPVVGNRIIFAFKRKREKEGEKKGVKEDERGMLLEMLVKGVNQELEKEDSCEGGTLLDSERSGKEGKKKERKNREKPLSGMLGIHVAGQR